MQEIRILQYDKKLTDFSCLFDHHIVPRVLFKIL